MRGQHSQGLISIYTRLQYGISLRTATWQRSIEQVLAELNGTCVIMVDLLVVGVNDDEHLRNLQAVLQLTCDQVFPFATGRNA